MADFLFFDEFIGNLGESIIDLNGDTFKAVLSNTPPDPAADDELADITQIVAGNGYVTDGETLASVLWAETGPATGVWRFTSDDFSWTAIGGAIAEFQYIVIYDDTSIGKKLVGYWDFGAPVNITTGNIFETDIGANGIFELGRGVIS